MCNENIIIQSGNIPIYLEFNRDLAHFDKMRITLYWNDTLLKTWEKEDVEINRNVVIIPLTQAETASFPVGNVKMNIKALNKDGIVNFAKSLPFIVKAYQDKQVFNRECEKRRCQKPIKVKFYTSSTIVKKGYSPFYNEDTDTWWEFDDISQNFKDTGIGFFSKKDYSIKPISEYFYEIYYYSTPDYNYAKEYFEKHHVPFEGACSAIRNERWYGRNLDWTYDEGAEFVVHTDRTGNHYATLGVSVSIPTLTNEKVKTKKHFNEYRILPFKIVDGINEYGVTINTNVVPTDKGITFKSIPDVEEHIDLPINMIPRFVLDYFKTAKDAVEYIRDFVSIYNLTDYSDNEYELHFMVADKEQTFLIEFIDEKNVITEMTAGTDSPLNGKPYLTNFYLSDVTFNDDGKVYTPLDVEQSGVKPSEINNITSHGAGLERYNLIVDNYESAYTKHGMRQLLDKLKYTNTYKVETQPRWCSEFVVGDIFTVDTPAQDFNIAFAFAEEVFENRSRDPESEYFGTWQTTHSCIYNIYEKKLAVIPQESGMEFYFTLDYPMRHDELAEFGLIPEVEDNTLIFNGGGMIYGDN